MSDVLIVIPARFASTRLPGKPLIEIAKVSMLRRTAKIAERAGYDFTVATDHEKIVEHCKAYKIPVVLTDANLASGTDRTMAALQNARHKAEMVVNLQGDAPFTEPSHIKAIAERLRSSWADVATPTVTLDWSGLDKLRAAKQKTPFSGTTVIVNDKNEAVWFSKTIIPAMRNEAELRQTTTLSPICQHIGLYAYTRDALERFVKASPAPYETLEGLEQLRALNIGLNISAVDVSAGRIHMSGIDSPEDIDRAEGLIAKHGDPFYE